MASQEEVRLIIKAITDEAVKKLDRLNNTMEESRNIQKNTSTTVGKLKTSWINFSAGLTVVGNVSRTVYATLKKGMDLAEAAAKFNQSTQAMEMQFGVSSALIIQRLREVSAGTVDMSNLVTAANRAMALNVTKDVDQMAQLLEYARLRARAMGTDTTSAFNDIVTGIGRASPLILDNLGIITKGWNEEAKAVGVAYDAQFILQKVLQQSAAELQNIGELAITDAEKFQQLNARWEDTKLILGQGILVSLFAVIDAFKAWPFHAERAGHIVNATLYGLAAVAVEVAGKIVEPFIWAINKMIEGLNRLPGVHLEKMNNMVAQGAEYLEKLVEQEELKLEILQLKREEDLENIQIDNEKRAEMDAAHKQRMLNIENVALNKSTKNKKKKLDKDLMYETDAQKQGLQNMIKYRNALVQIDTELLNLKIQNRGLDTQSYQQWSNFMMGALDKNSRTQFAIWKAFAIQSTIITTFQAAMNAYNAMAGIPIVGPALGAVAAGVTAAFGAIQVAKIASTNFKGAEEGALIRGVPGTTGTLIRAGENNKDEAIIPLEDSDVMDRLGGGVTVNFNVDTMVAGEDFPRETAMKIDDALYKLKEEGLSKL